MTEDVVGIHDRLARRQQLPEEVAGYVRELIITGAVRPGEFLRMERIAEAVGVSNTPVREGLLILRSEGLVELVPRRGFVVSPFSRQDVRDLFWAQAQLARELAARAARKISPEQLAAIRSQRPELRHPGKPGCAARSARPALRQVAGLYHAFYIEAGVSDGGRRSRDSVSDGGRRSRDS